MMELISLKQAVKLGLSRYFTGKPCKHGHISERITDSRTCSTCNTQRVGRYQKEHPEQVKKYKQDYRLRNTEKIKVSKKTWCLNNLDKTRENSKRWAQDNPGKARANTVKRRAAKLQRTPSWANLDKIREFYEESARLTRETGVQYVVDHVIPLQGENVSGLHTHDNLQVITFKANAEKSNKFEIE